MQASFIQEKDGNLEVALKDGTKIQMHPLELYWLLTPSIPVALPVKA